MKPRLLHGCPLAVATVFLSLAACPANPPTPPVEIDAPGRTNAQRHLAAFFQALNP